MFPQTNNRDKAFISLVLCKYNLQFFRSVPHKIVIIPYISIFLFPLSFKMEGFGEKFLHEEQE